MFPSVYEVCKKLFYNTLNYITNSLGKVRASNERSDNNYHMFLLTIPVPCKFCQGILAGFYRIYTHEVNFCRKLLNRYVAKENVG